MQMTWKKAWGHFKTITAHRHRVIAHCKKAGIFWQGLFHDLSKYTPTEFCSGARYYTDGRKSPNEAERLELGYSLAWMHHKGRNRHHFEYWQDYNPNEKKYMPVAMPKRFFKELICDRIAASKIYQGAAYTDASPLAYLDRARESSCVNPATFRQLHFLLTMLAEKGEDETFRFIREVVLTGKEFALT